MVIFTIIFYASIIPIHVKHAAKLLSSMLISIDYIYREIHFVSKYIFVPFTQDNPVC